jgi:hypothetical protein
MLHTIAVFAAQRGHRSGDTRDAPHAEIRNMSLLRFILSQRTMRLYLIGHLLILIGAGLMELTQSMIPMALAASAAVMLMFPLLRQLSSRFARSDSEKPGC